ESGSHVNAQTHSSAPTQSVMEPSDVLNDDAADPCAPCKRCRQLRKQVKILSGSNAAILQASQSLETEKNELTNQLEAKDRIITRMEDVHAERALNAKQVLETQNRFLEANKRLLEEKVKSLEAQLNRARRNDEEHQKQIQIIWKRAFQFGDQLTSLHEKNAAAEAKVTELETQVQEDEKETARLQEISQLYFEQVEALQSELEDLGSSLERATSSKAKEVNLFAAEKARLNFWVRSLREELSDEEKKVQELQNEATQLRRALELANDYAVQIESLRNEVEDLRCRRENEKSTSQQEMKDLRATLENENSASQKEIRALTAEKGHLEVWVKSLQKEVEDAQAKQEAHRLLAIEAQAFTVELENAMKVLEARLAGSEAIAEKRREEIVTLVAINEGLSEQMKSFRARQESLEKSAAEGEAAKLALKLISTRASSLEGTLKTAEAKLSERNTEIAALTSAKTTIKAEIQNLRQERTSHKYVVAELEEAKKALNVRINSLEASLASSNASEEVFRQKVDRLTTANGFLLKQSQSFCQQEEHHRRVAREAGALNVKLETRIASLETSLSASEATAMKRQREIDALRAENTQLTEKNQSLCKQEQRIVSEAKVHTSKLETRIASLETSLKASNAIVEERKKEIDACTEQLKSLRLQEETNRQAVAEAKVRITKFESRILLLEATLAGTDAVAEQRREELAELTSENDRLVELLQSLCRQEEIQKSAQEKAGGVALKLVNAKLKSLEKSHKVAEPRVEGKTLEAAALSSEIAILKEQIQNLRRQNELHEQNVAGAKATEVSLQTQVKGLEERLAAAEAATEGTRHEVAILTASNTTLTEELNTLRTKQQQIRHHLPTPTNSPQESKVQIRKITSLRKSLKDARRMTEHQKKTIRAKHRQILALKTAKVGLERHVEALENQVTAMRGDISRHQQVNFAIIAEKDREHIPMGQGVVRKETECGKENLQRFENDGTRGSSQFVEETSIYYLDSDAEGEARCATTTSNTSQIRNIISSTALAELEAKVKSGSQKNKGILSGSNGAILEASQSLETVKNELTSQLEAKDRIITRMEDVHAERALNVKQVLETQNRLLEANKKLLEEKVKSLEAQLNQARRNDEEHHKRSKKIGKERFNLRTSSHHFTKRRRQRRRKSLREELSDEEKKVLELKSEVTQLRRFSELANDHAVQIESLRNEVEDLRSRLENEKSTSQKEMKSLAVEKCHFEVWVKSLQKLLEAAQAKEEMNRRNAAETEASRAELSNQISLLEAHLAGTNTVAEKRRNEILALAADNERLLEQIKSLRERQESLEKSSSEEGAAKAALKLLNTRNQIQNRPQPGESHKRVVAEMEKTKSALDIRINSLEASLAASVASAEVLRQNVARLTAVNARLTKKSQSFRQQEHKHRQVAAKAGAAGVELGTRITSLETSLKVSEAIAADRKRHMDVLIADNVHLTEQIKSLRRQEETNRQALAEAQVLTAKFGRRILLPEATLAGTDAIAEQRREELAELTSENARLMERIRSQEIQRSGESKAERVALKLVNAQVKSLQDRLESKTVEAAALTSEIDILKEQVRNLHWQTDLHERNATGAKAAQISLETQIKSLATSLAVAEAATDGTRHEVANLTASNTTLTEELHTLRTHQQQTHDHPQTTPKSPQENKMHIRKITSLRKSLNAARRMTEYQKKTIRAKYTHIFALKTARVRLERQVGALESQVAAMRADISPQQQEYHAFIAEKDRGLRMDQGVVKKEAGCRKENLQPTLFNNKPHLKGIKTESLTERSSMLSE
ncbi:hypothetical protein HK102_000231, partial [Quaeritorhiza haematococci]